MPNYTQRNARTRSGIIILCTCFVATPGVPHKGNSQTYLTVKDDRSLTPYGSPDLCPQADTFWREKRRRSSQPSPHALLYLELPWGQPIRIRTEGQQPRRDWRRRVYPRKKSIHGERDSRVGEDKEKIKTRTSSKTGLKYWPSINPRSSDNTSAIKCTYSCKLKSSCPHSNTSLLILCSVTFPFSTRNLKFFEHVLHFS